MRNMMLISLILTAISPIPVYAGADTAELSIIQYECAQVGDVSFGTGQAWSDCHVSKGSWVATIGLTDMYQAQYCFGNGKDACDQRALVLFGNRAYTPKAKLLVQRIDPGSTTYDDPIVVLNEYGRILVLAAHYPDGGISNNYYLWQKDKWALIDTKGWLEELSERLPDGVSARKGGLPNIDTMSAQARLYRNTDGDCCPSAGIANVQLGLHTDKERFFFKSMSLFNQNKD
ncbi:MAG: hypothetical protein HOO95_08470 [Gallionella sp.]|nr:hypothetical protein [Gallionella sp.]